MESGEIGESCELGFGHAQARAGFAHEARFPKPEADMGFEGRHASEDAFVFEVRRAPFDGFFELGTPLMHEIAELAQTNGHAKPS